LKDGDRGLSGDELVKAIIGCYARETRPRTSAEKSFGEFIRLLYGISAGSRKRKLERLIALSSDAVDAARRQLADQAQAFPVILAGTAAAEKAAKSLGTEITALPV
jgi:hypothetical protein